MLSAETSLSRIDSDRDIRTYVRTRILTDSIPIKLDDVAPDRPTGGGDDGLARDGERAR